MSNGIEDQLVDSFVSEDNKFLDLFSPDRMKELFGSFKEAWQDPDKRVEYETLKGALGEKYMTDPAKYVGFIEESPDMHKDVISAAEETGVDPEFLYTVAMQEGMSEDMKNSLYWEYAIYNSARSKSSFTMGMDALFTEQDLAYQRGYLDEKIQSQNPKNMDTIRNEAGMEVITGSIASKDVWRGTGAMLQLNKDYLINFFQKDGVDFNNLPEETQQFWTYSAYNAGAGSANKLFKTYGVDPFQDPEFRSKIQKYTEYYDPNRTEYIEPDSSVLALGKWMKNVGRVVGGTKLTDMYSPFSGELYK